MEWHGLHDFCGLVCHSPPKIAKSRCAWFCSPGWNCWNCWANDMDSGWAEGSKWLGMQKQLQHLALMQPQIIFGRFWNHFSISLNIFHYGHMCLLLYLLYLSKSNCDPWNFVPLLMPSAKLQTFSQSICDGIRHILHFIIFISVVTLLRIDFPHFPVSFEAAIMRQSWYPGHVGDSTGFRRFEDLPTANFSDNGLPTRKGWVSRYPPFFQCSCTSQFTKDQRQSLRLLPSAYFQYHCHRSDLRGPKGTQKKRSEIVMKDLVSWSAQRCHWCGETFRGPIFTAARRCSGVDVPADDPLHNGARQHDEAVRELQGETVGDLIVEARLRWDGHSVSGFSGFFHHGKHGKQYQVLGNFHRFHSKDAADLRRQEGSPESHQCMT